MKVFVHGVPDTIEMWKELISALGLAEYEYEALSLPGFGCDTPNGFNSTMLSYSNWLIKELESISDKHGGPIDLVGHDWGAILASRAASLRPDLINSLVFSGAAIDSKYRGHLFAWLWATPLIGEFVMAIMRRDYLRKLLIAQGLSNKLAADEVIKFDRTMKQSILRLYRSAAGLKGLGIWESDLANLPTKKLLIWGEKDPYVPLKVAQRFIKLWGGEIHIEQGVGHWAIINRPETVSLVLKKFWGG